jgi:hypothetical protein
MIIFMALSLSWEDIRGKPRATRIGSGRRHQSGLFVNAAPTGKRYCTGIGGRGADAIPGSGCNGIGGGA